jgi:hypothetical protein
MEVVVFGEGGGYNEVGCGGVEKETSNDTNF